jgi:hypothetical protein
MKLGYVARITRPEEFEVPSSLSDIGTLLKALAVMLLIYSLVKSTIIIINEPEEPNLRSKLMNLYTHTSNRFQKPLKRNISAVTPEDDVTSRFKSIFPKK